MSDGEPSANGSRPNGHDPFAGLRNPYVRAFAVGRTASSLGMQFISVAVGWELYERTGDPWALGLVGLFEVLPVAFLMIPAGNAADRFARRDVGILAHLLLGASALGLAWWSSNAAPVELVYALLVAIGAARAFSSPSVETILPQLIDRRVFANVQAWLISCGQLSSIGGPALGGVLIAVFGGATWNYAIAACLELVFIGMLLMLPRVAPPPAGAKRELRDLFAGLAFIRRNPIILSAITLDLFAVLFGGAVALLPIFAKDILEVGPSGLGILRAAPAVGALLTALLVTRLPPWQRPGRVLLVVVCGFGVATIGFGLSRDLWLSLACLYMVGATDSVSMVIRGTLLQMVVPDHLRGRVAAVEYMFIGFSNELGAFESGAVAALAGPIFAVVSGGVGTLIVVAVIMILYPALARIGPLHTLRPIGEEGRRNPSHVEVAGT